jgi:ribA/ribD-fused uncharacterized protein
MPDQRPAAAPIQGFRDDHFFLSNFYPSSLTADDGIAYPTVEHAFQAHKTHDLAERRRIANLAAPAKAKHAGRRVPLRPDWESVKVDVMRQLVTAKFRQNPDLATQLLATGQRHLEETNTWNDTYWGVCRGNGKNKLGLILMEVRAELRDPSNHGKSARR